jgi:hypothetical protein
MTGPAPQPHVLGDLSGRYKETDNLGVFGIREVQYIIVRSAPRVKYRLAALLDVRIQA